MNKDFRTGFQIGFHKQKKKKKKEQSEQEYEIGIGYQIMMNQP